MRNVLILPQACSSGAETVALPTPNMQKPQIIRTYTVTNAITVDFPTFQNFSNFYHKYVTQI